MNTLSGLLAESPFFAGMRPIQLERLSFCAQHRAFPAGSRMCDEDDPADQFWVIRAGLVGLDTRLTDDTVTTVETLGPGTVVGWLWLLPPYRWPFGAVAVTPTSTVELDAAGLRRLCTGNAAIGRELTRRSIAVAEQRLAALRARLGAATAVTRHSSGTHRGVPEGSQASIVAPHVGGTGGQCRQVPSESGSGGAGKSGRNLAGGRKGRQSPSG